VLNWIIKNQRIVLVVISVIISIVVLFAFFGSSSSDEVKPSPTRTTTTTLPKKNAQACEFLMPQALLAGGIIADVEPIRSKDLRRCTYEDIGGEVNYLTLYIDEAKQCDTLVQAAKDTSLLPEVSKGAVYTEELDPTIFVKQDARCFFVQGSKTLVDKDSLIAITIAITDLFIAVDSSTTTTTPATVVLPEEAPSTLLPGQNTAPTTMAPVT